MMTESKPAVGPRFLGIEGGGTRTVALLADDKGALLRRFATGPSNLRLLDDPQLASLLTQLAAEFPDADAVAVGLAGARNLADRTRLKKAVNAAWPGRPAVVTNDLETALLADAQEGEADARVLVLSGTGSCCFGRAADGRTAKIGGWGQILGDKGSGYEIGLRALKAVVYYLDREGEWSALGQRILRTLLLNEPDDLIGWVQQAPKAEVAALAKEVFEAAAGGDKIARDILEGAAHSLARDAVDCAVRLAKTGARVRFVLAGGVLLQQDAFARQVGRLIRRQLPKSQVAALRREGAWGAVRLAHQAWEAAETSSTRVKPKSGARPAPVDMPATFIPKATQMSPTELRNPRSMNFHRMSVDASIQLMLEEEGTIPASLLKSRKQIGQAVTFIAKALRGGGRLFYAGAGTSGRLGVLDSSECPPTFRAAPEMVQAIMAGGQTALWRSLEGAEDDAVAGARAVEFRGVRKGDVVVGIAASGRTPFVWGALAEARSRGARTLLLCFNPYLDIPKKESPDVVIAVDLGAEVLTGSTRLKAGTATKLVLNVFSTLAMVRLGKVVSNLMVDMNPSNLKLQDRAIRIVRDLSGCERAEAEKALVETGWRIKEAWLKTRGKTKVQRRQGRVE